ncbi:hypothetical protein ADUPG1_011754, partial [Aduncisulcus paluster]
VYNDIEEVKQCAWIAKEGDNGECYTIHDDNVRSYLTNTLNLTTESNGILTIPTLLGLTSAIDLSGIASSVTSLQGLEYVVNVTSLTLDGYDLSGDDAAAEYDRTAIQILAKGVDASYSYSYSSISTGLTSLSLSGCALDKLEDVLDLTPIHAEDDATSNFKLISLDL